MPSGERLFLRTRWSLQKTCGEQISDAERIFHNQQLVARRIWIGPWRKRARGSYVVTLELADRSVANWYFDAVEGYVSVTSWHASLRDSTEPPSLERGSLQDVLASGEPRLVRDISGVGVQ